MRNPAASIRQRLLNRARQGGEDFNLILTRYAAERLLFRLSQSRYRSSFILKGAILLSSWRVARHRPTRDLDLTGYGSRSAGELAAVFREIAEQPVEFDGLVFDAHGITVPARLGNARIKVQVDVGLGDVVTPDPQEMDYPTLLDSPSPRSRAYPPEAVIAEKLHAMISLSIRNSRMKDFYDLLVLSREFPFKASSLAASIATTFERRHTALPSDAPAADFVAVVRELAVFLLPVLGFASTGSRLPESWKPGGPWE